LCPISAVAPRKAAALRAQWLDAVIVVVSTPLFGSFLSSLRLVQLVRLLRLLRLGAILQAAAASRPAPLVLAHVG
jgi:hypothetical protein